MKPVIEKNKYASLVEFISVGIYICPFKNFGIEAADMKPAI